MSMHVSLTLPHFQSIFHSQFYRVFDIDFREINVYLPKKTKKKEQNTLHAEKEKHEWEEMF